MRHRRIEILLCCALAATAGCDASENTDAGRPDAGRMDAGAADASARDGGLGDGGLGDGGLEDGGGSDAGAIDAGPPRHTWFEMDSAWTEDLPEPPVVTSNSAEILATLPSSFAINNSEWSVPVWRVAAGTPLLTVPITRDPTNETRLHIEANEWNRVPITPEMRPPGHAAACSGTYRDGHMTVCDDPMTTCWDFFQARYCDGMWSARTIRRWDMSGHGVNHPFDGFAPTRACAGAPSFAGLVTRDEMASTIADSGGSLDHALMIAWQGSVNTVHRTLYPCGDQFYMGAYDGTVAFMGQSFQLDPTFDCESAGCDDVGRVVCRTLQRKGAILVDNTCIGCPVSVYFESVIDHPTRTWSNINGDGSGLNASGIGGNSVGCIPPGRLIAVERPPLP